MLSIIKKSYEITINNPVILIFWVAYWLVILVCSQILMNAQGSHLFIIALLMVLLLNSAFFAGWFAVIKKAIKNSSKKYENVDEKYEDMLKLNNVFFSSVPNYIMPVLGVIIMYCTGFILWLTAATILAKKFIGNTDFLVENIKSISGSTAETLQYLQSLSTEQLRIIYGSNLFLAVAIMIFGILTLFLFPALYFEKNNKKSPIRAFVDSAKTILKRPLGVIGFSIVNQFLFFVLTIAQVLCLFNTFLCLVYALIFIYITAFMIVLSFNYYDKRFANNCVDGSDSFGQN